MSDIYTSVSDRVAQMPRPAQLYFKQIMKQADGDIFAAIENLRNSQSDGSIELELRPAANMAMVALTGRLNGPEQRPKTEAEAMDDMRERMEQARLKGDRASYDAHRAALAHTEAKAKRDEERWAKKSAGLEASKQAFEDQKKAKYETLLANSKDMEMQKIRRMGYQGAEAEAYYNEWARKATEVAAQTASGYTPHTPIEE